jgi:hypothetical protein
MCGKSRIWLMSASNESEVSGMVVAVRIKPLDEHEDEELSVQAVGNNLLKINSYEPKTYQFDFVHWSTRTSHDSPGYVSQEMVFENVGQPIVQNSSLGYNCSLFAYGQTVSGEELSFDHHTSFFLLDDRVQGRPIPCSVSEMMRD